MSYNKWTGSAREFVAGQAASARESNNITILLAQTNHLFAGMGGGDPWYCCNHSSVEFTRGAINNMKMRVYLPLNYSIGLV